jgi:hypothetical protein
MNAKNAQAARSLNMDTRGRDDDDKVVSCQIIGGERDEDEDEDEGPGRIRSAGNKDAAAGQRRSGVSLDDGRAMIGIIREALGSADGGLGARNRFLGSENHKFASPPGGAGGGAVDW